MQVKFVIGAFFSYLAANCFTNASQKLKEILPMNNSSYYVFLRPTSIPNDKEQVLYIRIILDRKKKDYSLKIRTLLKYWNAEKQELKIGHPNFKEDSLKLQYLLTSLSKLTTDALFDNRILSFQDFDQIFKGEVNMRISFYKFVEQLVKEKSGKVSPATIQVWDA